MSARPAKHQAASLAAREPVRVYLYGVAAAVAALAVALDYVDVAVVPLWLGLAGAVLAVPTVELTRSVVTSPASRAELEGALTLTAKRPDADQLASGLRKLAVTPDVGPEASAMLLKAASDLDDGQAPALVLSRLMAEVGR